MQTRVKKTKKAEVPEDGGAFIGQFTHSFVNYTCTELFLYDSNLLSGIENWQSHVLILPYTVNTEIFVVKIFS